LILIEIRPSGEREYDMADPVDLMKAWEEAIREVTGAAAGLVTAPVGVAADVREQLQRQAEQLQRVLQRQLDFERELMSRVVAPAHAVLDLVDQATAAFRAQAAAFRAAAESFVVLADLMDQQAVLVERTSATIRDPLAVVRSAGGATPGEPADQ
jgi:hypothetical protein